MRGAADSHLVLGAGQLDELGLPLDHLGLHVVGLLLGAGAEVVDDAQAVLDVLHDAAHTVQNGAAMRSGAGREG